MAISIKEILTLLNTCQINYLLLHSYVHFYFFIKLQKQLPNLLLLGAIHTALWPPYHGIHRDTAKKGTWRYPNRYCDGAAALS